MLITMSTIVKEEDKISPRVKQYLPYRIEHQKMYVTYVGDLLQGVGRSSKTEIAQVRSFLNTGIIISGLITAFIASMTGLKVFEESISIPLLAVAASILLAFSIERRKKRA